MAERLNTVEFWFPTGANFADATATSFSSITVALPDIVGTTSSAFKSVAADLIFHDRNTTIGSVTRRQLGITLGASAESIVNNTETVTNGGEQQTMLFTADYTTYFNTAWVGSAMTVAATALIDCDTASPLGPSFVNNSLRLVITYLQNDASATQVKTVRIPLDCWATAMRTTKAAAAAVTIPALDTELPEGGKTFLQNVIVLQGSDQGTSTGLTFQWGIDAATTYSSYAYEHGSNTAMFVRMHNVESFTTASAHSWYSWANNAGNHMQAWLTSTYKFTLASTTTVMTSLLLACGIPSPMGYSTSADYQRGVTELWIEEPAPITTKQIAFYVFFDNTAAITGLNARIGTSTFTAYLDAVNVFSGSNTLMVRDDTAFTLARGRNRLNVDMYQADGTDNGAQLGGFWMVNYQHPAPTVWGSQNQTILWTVKAMDASALSRMRTIAATSFTFPESSWFINNLGVEGSYVHSGTAGPGSQAILVERLSAESAIGKGIQWDSLYRDIAQADGETGIYQSYGHDTSVFKRWAGDADANRIALSTARRWTHAVGQSNNSLMDLCVWITYHSITFSVTSAISGSSGATVLTTLMCASCETQLLTSSRVGDGNVTFTWYDNTKDVYTSAYETDALVGRSGKGKAV